MGNREIKELVSETVMVREKANGRRSLRGRGWGWGEVRGSRKERGRE